MTSDTKIGLLLGLVFIFVIAFLINGLPSFRNHLHGSGLTEQMIAFGEQAPGIAASERQVQSRLAPAIRLPEPQRSALFENLQFAAPNPTDPIRTKLDLPGYPGRMDSQLQRDMHQKASDAISHVQAPSRAQNDTKSEEPFIHIVESNDNLALIAKRYYGKEEGNRRINSDRIFKANRKTLDSPDQIRVGQRLIVPRLPDQVEKAFVRVPRVVSPTAKKKVNVSTKTAKTKWYKVKEGDSLWRIATSMLGNGGRYQDIIRMNKDLLGDENNLTVGTRLRLPAR